MFGQAQSSRGRQIRPTPKMTDMMAERIRKQERRTGTELANELYTGTLASASRSTRLDVRSLQRLQQEVEEEIRNVQFDISQREEELQASHRIRQEKSGDTKLTPVAHSSRNVSPSEQLEGQSVQLGPTLEQMGRDAPHVGGSGTGFLHYRGKTYEVVDETGSTSVSDVLKKTDIGYLPTSDRKSFPNVMAPEFNMSSCHGYLHPGLSAPVEPTHQPRSAMRPAKQADLAFQPRPATSAQSMWSHATHDQNPQRYPDVRCPATEEEISQPQAATATQIGRDNDESLLQRLADLLTNKQDRLPRMEPEVFTGDLLKFPMWWNSFEALIEKKTELASERLFFLGKYTAGDARSCIQGYLTLYTDAAYIQAKSVLLSRYGDKVKVAKAYKGRLDEWPPVKPHDGEGLQKFADFLWQCNAAMSTVSYLCSLDSAEENEKMVKKLPYYIADRWRRVVDRSLYTGGKNTYEYAIQPDGHYPRFAEFCRFISDEARVACGPCSARPTSQNNDKATKSRKARTFSTQASAPSTEPKEEQKKRYPPRCLFCKGPHYISKCNTFLGQNTEAKKSYARSNGLCFGCLRRNHLYRDCRSRDPTLMEEERPKTASTEQAQSDKTIEGRATSYQTATSRIASQQGLKGILHTMVLPVVVSHIDNPEVQVETYALLDNMSDSCFVKEELIKGLQAKSVTTNLEVTTLVTKKVVSSEMVKGLTIRGVKENTVLQMPRTYGREEIPMERDLIPKPETVRIWPHLQHVAEQLQPYNSDLDIGVLIGSNFSSAMVPEQVIAGEPHEPYAMKTRLGWGVVGWVQPPSDSEQMWGAHFVHRTSTREISPLEVHKMFQVEFMENATDTKQSIEDKQFLEMARNGIHQRSDSHFEMPLPLKKGVQLPNNKEVAVKRLRQLKARLLRDERYRQDYTDFMLNVIERGYAEVVPPDEVEGSPGRTWYIPHHGVYHPKKPGKIRIVYDCSAEFQGLSLNRCLLQGPDLTNSLTGILCRFREEPIAITCDIEGMFHQVGVDKGDRDFLRFLWWENGDLGKTPKEYRMTVHLFGATSSPACANFALKATADKGEERFGREVADFVRKNFYVDDGLQSVSTSEEAVTLVKKARELCQTGGFNLHKFISNDKTVVARIPEDIRAKNIQKIDLRHCALPVERTLGVEWCVESDTFQFRVVLNNKPTTRRGILSAISSIYDPLGLVSPFLLTGKRILQELCKDRRGWDDPVDEQLEVRWERWKSELYTLAHHDIPRCYKPENFGKVVSIQLHHFSDASSSGYGQCSYLRLVDKDNQVATSLVMAKARVAPAKTITIPRLELTASVTSVKISTFLNKELTYNEVQNFYWTDSQVVLGYIANDSKRFHVFVANRVQQIRDKTEVQEWHYVQTKKNPADLASRGATAQELVNTQIWWKGPEFLSSVNPLPLMANTQTVPDGDPEVKKGIVHHSTVRTPKYVDILDRLRYFSNWHRARKAIALCRRYVRILKDRCFSSKKSDVQGLQPITVEEIQDAERIILMATQQRDLPQCHAILKKTKGYLPDRWQARQRRTDMAKQGTNLFRLDPYLGTDGLIRVGGRIRRANIPRELAHPVIVPEGHVAKLLIEYFHKKSGHSGRGTTLNEIRASGYWILRSRPLVNSALNRCVTCRKLRYQPATQKMADLPEDRLAAAPPFTYVGVDYFGPFYVKEGRSERKRWGCMFTCLVTRAAHLEVAHSLSTDSFLNAYRRLVGRRGPVRSMRSDRGTNFVGARAELEAALSEMNHEKIQRELLLEGCDWTQFNMNVPHASHMGGAWERMIRTAKTTLSSLLAQHASSLDDELLHTLMVEVEAIINSRPLTEVDPDMEPLTPNHLLTMKAKVVLPPPGIFRKEDLYCRKRWRRIQYLANEFWTRWTKEYLPSLQRRQKWTNPKMNLEIGDVVMMVDEATTRSRWPKAIVTDVYPGNDGLVRKVTVRTSKANYERPVHKVIFLYRPTGSSPKD